MYQNPYLQNLNQQNINDRIDNEIERLKQMKTQIQQPIQPITQNFQISPSHNVMKYATTLEEVQKEMVYTDTPFFSKDLSIMWLKNSKGDIKAYELKEIVQKDEKDLQIDFLQKQIEELKGMIVNEQHNSNANREDVSTRTSNDNETIRKQVEDDKSTSIQRVSRSKK